jgi:hypothetical protein
MHIRGGRAASIQLPAPAVDSGRMSDPFLGLAVPGPADEQARWAQVRRPRRHSDDALTGTARLWLRRLPPARKPLRLCERFPRVANRIAWCWPDALLCTQVFDDLLVDRRGGRQGFPRPVVVELRRLRDYRDQQQLGEAGAPARRGFWDLVRHPFGGR